MTKKAYICGKLGENKSDFMWGDVFARMYGYVPVRKDRLVEALDGEFDYDEVAKITDDVIFMCDLVIMLDGWQDDKTCNLELSIAKSYNKKICYQGYYARRGKLDGETGD